MLPMVEDGLKIRLVLFGWACISLCLISYTTAFSHGASLTACSDMRPQHIRAQPQNPRKNYITIHTNRTSYLPGDKVPVTVRSSRDFMGFLLQARRVSNDQVAGSFVFIPPGSKVLRCFEDGDTVTHSDKSLKRNLSFVWKSPDQPVGDIKFFLSVVQSYFIYWARIESAIVSGQTQNRTFAATTAVKSKPISSTASQESQEPEGSNVHINPVSGLMPASTMYITRTSTVAPSSISSAGTDPSEILPPSVPGLHEDLMTDVKSLIKIPPKSVTPLFSTSTFGDGTAEPSLPSHVPRTFLQGLPSQNDPSNRSIQDRVQSVHGTSRSQLCAACEEDAEEVATGFPRSPSRPRLPPDSQTWKILPLLPTGELLQDPRRDSLQEEQSSSRSASTASDEEDMATKKMSANFLHQPDHAASDEKTEDKARGTSPWVTRPIREVVPGKGRESTSRGMQLAATQLGILLGCSAALGMALAAGLRCIHAQYCHKRTEVSFSEPDNNVITARENGDMMHFRKIRENSFVLVQAEYNWITPASDGKPQ
ncbi:reelin domain-containing protein 1 [Ascaphus truei]|uniref:reelin domain-containing protein 1 n=1 Tax=Ascaphus truei TaxID=8439 RepID=UPI003F5ABCF3